MTGPRFSLTLLTAALLVGCQHGPGGTLDPFGRTTIPPPPTGAASIHSPKDQYYGNPARPMVPVASAPGNATAAAPQPSAQTQPTAQTTSWASTAESGNRLQPIPPYENKSASQPAPAPAPAPASVPAPAPTAQTAPPVAGSQPTQVSPPPAAPVDPTAPLKWSSGNPGPQQAKPATAPVQVATGQNVTVRREPVDKNPPRISRYGYTKDYTSVRGRLEYAAQDRTWTIRYIPAHGEKDAYGGQFILSDRSKLEAFAAGDYVTVYGTPVAGNDAGGPPHYMPSRVVPNSP